MQITTGDFQTATPLIREYAGSLGIDLGYQQFDRELEQLPQMYGPPCGLLLVASDGESAAGCVAVRRLSDTDCEMKRLYVVPSARDTGIGRELAERAIQEARRLGYSRMLLDTLPSMTRARQLYASLGFRETEPYYVSAVETSFLALDLRSAFTADEVADLVRQLSDAPARYGEIVAQTDAVDVTRRHGDDEFCLVEHLCHLRDLEREAWGVRIQRMLAGEEPEMADFDGLRAAEERRYVEDDIRRAHAAFIDAREANVAAVAAVPYTQLRRGGTLEGRGRISVNDLLVLMREHDEGHLEAVRTLAAL